MKNYYYKKKIINPLINHVKELENASPKCYESFF